MSKLFRSPEQVMVGGPAGGVLETIGKVSAAEVLRAWRRGQSLLFGLVCSGLTCPGPSISDWPVKDWILETELLGDHSKDP